MSINVAEVFAYLNVDELKKLAQRHNVSYNIKAPTSMLKAELVKSLADHYVDLVGDELIPIPSKPLKLDKKQIPPKFQTKKPKEEKNDKMSLWLKQWLSQKDNPVLSSGKDNPEVKKAQRREARNEAYLTKKKLEESIKKREASQAKAKEARLKKAREVLKKDKIPEDQWGAWLEAME